MTRITTFTLLFGLVACSDDTADPNYGLGGQFGQTDDCGTPTVTSLAVDEQAPNGLAPADLMDGLVAGLEGAPLEFEDGQQTTIDLALQTPSNASYIEYESTEPECVGRLVFDVRVEIDTADGRLNESNMMAVQARSSDEISGHAILEPVQGGLVPSDFSTSTFDSLQVQLRVDFGAQVDGTVFGIGTNGDLQGDAPVLSETFPIAEF